MPDITMCKGTKCPISNSCYRFLAKPTNEYQSYFTEVPYDLKTNKCVYYWKLNGLQTDNNEYSN